MVAVGHITQSPVAAIALLVWCRFSPKQLLRWAANFPLFAVLAGERSPCDCVAAEIENDQNRQRYHKQPGEISYQEYDPTDDGEDEDQEIWQYVGPGGLLLDESLRVAPLEQGRAQLASS